MSIWRLILREILHRKLNFALAVTSAFVAVGVLVAEIAVLDSHDIRTAQILDDLHARQLVEMRQFQEAKMAELDRLQADQRRELADLQEQQRVEQARLQARQREEMKRLEDDYRKITKELGFNVLILPKEQDLAEYSHEGHATKYMPEEYVEQLANSKIVTVRHLLPTIEQKILWPERQVKVTLIGTRGEVPLLHRDPKKPIAEAVPPDKMVVGHGIHSRLGLNVGDEVVLKGMKFTVSKVHAEGDLSQDFAVWIHLSKAQELLDKKGKINAIWALECSCAWADISKVRQDILAILPDTQVKELASKAKARADARNRAAALHQQVLAEQKQAQARALRDQQAEHRRVLRDQRAATARAVRDHRAEQARALAEERRRRAQLGDQRRQFATWLIPLVVAGCAVWIALLAFSNVRQRLPEIGILRAIGVRRRHVLLVFLARAVLVGLIGALLGYVSGFLLGAVIGSVAVQASILADLFHWWLPPAVLLVAPLLAALASWAPAVLAAQHDPAVVLSQE